MRGPACREAEAEEERKAMEYMKKRREREHRDEAAKATQRDATDR